MPFRDWNWLAAAVWRSCTCRLATSCTPASKIYIWMDTIQWNSLYNEVLGTGPGKLLRWCREASLCRNSICFSNIQNLVYIVWLSLNLSMPCLAVSHIKKDILILSFTTFAKITIKLKIIFLIFCSWIFAPIFFRLVQLHYMEVICSRIIV
jgi:hypothetical protein